MYIGVKQATQDGFISCRDSCQVKFDMFLLQGIVCEETHENLVSVQLFLIDNPLHIGHLTYEVLHMR